MDKAFKTVDTVKSDIEIVHMLKRFRWNFIVHRIQEGANEGNLLGIIPKSG